MFADTASPDNLRLPLRDRLGPALAWVLPVSNTRGKSAPSLFGTQLCPPPCSRLREADWRTRASNHIRSRYEQHPPRHSKSLLIALGFSIFPDASVSPGSEPKAGQRDPRTGIVGDGQR